MPARLVQVTIVNSSAFPIVWQDDGREHGFWQEPWYPSNIKSLQPGQQASFRLESGGIATGVEGWALFKVDVPSASNVAARTEFFRLNFDRPYIATEAFKGDDPSHIQYFRSDPRTGDPPHDGPIKAGVRSVGTSDIANMDSSPFEFIPAIPFAPLNAYWFLQNESIAKHLAWAVEVFTVTETSALPLQAAPLGILYAVTPRIEAERTEVLTAQVGGGHTGGHGASGGDLMWFRHEGRLDGSFDWEGPEKVGHRWEGLSRVFSDGSGLVYGVTPRVPASRISETVQVTATGEHIGSGGKPASGGDLFWYRHLGRDDGSFRWEGPRQVGIRWDAFKHLFSGGNGVIYGVQQNGDLLWYRHVGCSDGSFIWQGPKKVGVGWGTMSTVFSGGDGILYAVTPRVEAGLHITGAVMPASGGDLLWFRHVGHEDGRFEWEGPRVVGARWDALSTVFAAGDGILYGITPIVDASIEMATSVTQDHVGGHIRLASGGDLLWYHHLGATDGSFRWDGPKKVGTGWGGLAHVFSGGPTRGTHA